MTVKNILGLVMVALPFFSFGIFIIAKEGLKAFFFIFGSTLFFISWFVTACYLTKQ